MPTGTHKSYILYVCEHPFENFKELLYFIFFFFIGEENVFNNYVYARESV